MSAVTNGQQEAALGNGNPFAQQGDRTTLSSNADQTQQAFDATLRTDTQSQTSVNSRVDGEKNRIHTNISTPSDNGPLLILAGLIGAIATVAIVAFRR